MKSLLFTFPLIAVAAIAEPAACSKVIDANLAAGAAAAQAALGINANKAASKAVRPEHKAYREAETVEATYRRGKLADLARATDPEKRAALVAELEARWVAAQSNLDRLKAAADTAEATPAEPRKE